MSGLELFFVLFCGLTFGSFVTLASYRLPLGEGIVVKPSRCPRCSTKLKFKDLWPVVSWTLSKGKCRYCGQPISARYPLTELATALLFLLIYLKYGLTFQAILLALFGVGLMVMIVADLEHFIIPDQVHLWLLPLGLIYHFVIGTPWDEVLYGFLAGLFLGLALHHGYRILRKREGLGYGDVKFLAIAGLWLTWQPLAPYLFYAGLFGVLTGLVWRAAGKGPVFPFGPALAIALFVCVVFPETTKLFWNLIQSV